jgi:hypothetical protein
VASFEAGGPYDFYARLIARFIGSHLPGSPNVVVQNMPGAGGLRGANFIYNLASRDGTVMGSHRCNVADAKKFRMRKSSLPAAWVRSSLVHSSLRRYCFILTRFSQGP